MGNIKDDLSVLLLTELVFQLGSNANKDEVVITSSVNRLAQEMRAIESMLASGDLCDEQAEIHRQLRINALKMRLLAIDGVADMELGRVVDGLSKVVRRFYQI